MAKIVTSPELRYTQDGDVPVAQMLVEFENVSGDSPTSTLKVVGWGKLAQSIQQDYSEGDTVIIEGRLTMNTIDRQEGFKEKRAELVASRIHPLNQSESATTEMAEMSIPREEDKNVVSFDSYQIAKSEVNESLTNDNDQISPEVTPAKDLDDIPF